MEAIMLDGKIAFISGAARGKGNGRAIALNLAGKGADIAVADIRIEEAEGVAEEIRAMGRKSLAVKMFKKVKKNDLFYAEAMKHLADLKG